MAKRSKARSSSPSPASFEKEAVATAHHQRRIQRNIDRSEQAEGGKEKEPDPMQAGVRSYPVPPLPKQHLSKPGSEADLKPEPLYDAPYYKGSDKLEGKVAL